MLARKRLKSRKKMAQDRRFVRRPKAALLMRAASNLRSNTSNVFKVGTRVHPTWDGKSSKQKAPLTEFTVIGIQAAYRERYRPYSNPPDAIHVREERDARKVLWL